MYDDLSGSFLPEVAKEKSDEQEEMEKWRFAVGFNIRIQIYPDNPIV